MMTLTLQRRTFGSAGSLLAATVNQENPDRNHKLSNIGSIEIYNIYSICRCYWNVASFKRTVQNGKL
jgi:hypothetical protein